LPLPPLRSVTLTADLDACPPFVTAPGGSHFYQLALQSVASGIGLALIEVIGAAVFVLSLQFSPASHMPLHLEELLAIEDEWRRIQWPANALARRRMNGVAGSDTGQDPFAMNHHGSKSQHVRDRLPQLHQQMVQSGRFVD
jgi:hypothetical protein